jgi:hypothetical protein
MTPTTKLTLIIGVAILAAGGIYLAANLIGLEQPSYRVVQTSGGIEYRQYDAYLVSETVIDAANNYKDAGDEGFRRLFGYISGGNSSSSKIAMTVPVAQTTASEKIAMTAPVQQTEGEEGWRVAFMLPGEYTLETAPQPADPRVAIREVPGRLTAALRFSGRWTEGNFARKRVELLQALEQAGVTPVGEVQSAFYNAPFSLPFFRRNEVLVEVERLPLAR